MIIYFVSLLANVLTWIILIYAVLTFIVPPTNSIRQGLEQVLSPMLDPIRRLIRPVGMFDFSPLVLLVLIYFVERIIISILN